MKTNTTRHATGSFPHAPKSGALHRAASTASLAALGSLLGVHAAWAGDLTNLRPAVPVVNAAPLAGVTPRAMGVDVAGGIAAMKDYSGDYGPYGVNERVVVHGARRVNGASAAEIIPTHVSFQVDAGFGDAIAIFGGEQIPVPRIVIGAPYEDLPNAEDGGAVYVFERREDSWQLVARFTAPDARPFANFGASVDIDRTNWNNIVVGAPGDSANGMLSGAAYLCALGEFGGVVMAGVQRLQVASGIFELAGASVACHGGWAVVGSPTASRIRLHRFESDGATVLVRDGVGGSGFGRSVSMWGSLVAVAAPFEPNATQTTGRLHLYSINQVGSLTVLTDILEVLPPFEAGVSSQFALAVGLDDRGMVAPIRNSDGSCELQYFPFDPTNGAAVLDAVRCAAPDSDDAGVSVAIDGRLAAMGSRTPDGVAPARVQGALYDLRSTQQDIDLDGDDDIEFALPATSKGAIWFLESGAWQFASSISTAPGTPLSFGAGWECLGHGVARRNGEMGTYWRNKASNEVRVVRTYEDFPSWETIKIPTLQPQPIAGKVLALADFTGDLMADLVVADPSGVPAVHVLGDGDWLGLETLAQIEGGTIAATGDFLGIGWSQLLVRQASTGVLALNGLGVDTTVANEQGQPLVLPSVQDVVACADFDGDCHDDLLVFHSATRRLAIWTIRNGQRMSVVPVGGTLQAGWSAFDAADIDGDYDPDILLRKSATRDVYRWTMDGVTRTSTGFLRKGPAGGLPINGLNARR